jgi:predicted metallo-beta-lactamase superfamily hydrolase
MINKSQYKKVQSIKKHIERVDKIIGQLDDDIWAIVSSPETSFRQGIYHGKEETGE